MTEEELEAAVSFLVGWRDMSEQMIAHAEQECRQDSDTAAKRANYWRGRAEGLTIAIRLFSGLSVIGAVGKEK